MKNRLIILFFLSLLVVFPASVLAQVEFGVSTTVSQSDEWLLSELTNSKISISQLRAGLLEPVKVVTILESFGKPVVNRKIKLKFEHQANISSEVAGITNEGGVWETKVASNIPGWVRITGYDITDGQEFKLLDEERFEVLRSRVENPPKADVFIGNQVLPHNSWISIFLNWFEDIFK